MHLKSFDFINHRDLNFDSLKRFCTRDFSSWANVLDYGKSKKDCLNFGRNKSSHANPQAGFEPGTPEGAIVRLEFVV